MGVGVTSVAGVGGTAVELSGVWGSLSGEIPKGG